MNNDPPTKTQNTQTVALVANQQLMIERKPGRDTLNLISSDGQISLSIHVTPDGPVVQVKGASLAIQAEGCLTIDAETVDIHARERMALSSGGDVLIQAKGDLHSTARTQNITAELGDANVKANDDVKLDGERIRMNC